MDLDAEALQKLAAVTVYIENDFDIKPSAIHGLGVFSRRDYAVGDVVFFFREPIFREEDFERLAPEIPELVSNAAARFVGPYMSFDIKLKSIDYINHNNDPNILYHCGIGFARKPIAVGDELTADYHYILTESETIETPDGDITGYPAQETLKRTTIELLQILSRGEKTA